MVGSAAGRVPVGLGFALSGGVSAVSGSRRRAFCVGVLVYEFDPCGDDCGALYQFLPEGGNVVLEESAAGLAGSSLRMAFQV